MDPTTLHMYDLLPNSTMNVYVPFTRGVISGAITSQYLLEKSRIVFQVKNTRAHTCTHTLHVRRSLLTHESYWESGQDVTEVQSQITTTPQLLDASVLQHSWITSLADSFLRNSVWFSSPFSALFGTRPQIHGSINDDPEAALQPRHCHVWLFVWWLFFSKCCNKMHICCLTNTNISTYIERCFGKSETVLLCVLSNQQCVWLWIHQWQPILNWRKSVVSEMLSGIILWPLGWVVNELFE